ncbi:C2H2-like zinc finger protein [Rhynchospora pubera]|uniref:C2H2-like zinc finger protein n=1 Tax=Rhynchospora pubera TaxID=906938 RepID=A0AAV8DJA2_9POAL|nr:C2H2-like zinc finger protein [Rhynchospora pubera]
MGVSSIQAKRESRKAANVLLSLSLASNIKKKSNKRKKNNGVFECKICNREFPSFQALGGHCTSHLRPKVRSDGIELKIGEKYKESTRHICGICGKEFQMGQALGGHMRLHRASPVSSALSQIRGEEEFDLNIVPTLTDHEKLGVYIGGDVVSGGFQYQGRLLNLFE